VIRTHHTARERAEKAAASARERAEKAAAATRK
jgi:hypothetical protein